MTRIVPFFRVRDAEASAAWYAQLGFEVESRHRFAPGLPLFVALCRQDAHLFLSEHAGDAPPRSLAYVHVDDVDGLAAALGIEPEDADYGLREIEVVDPDGNRLRFGAPLRRDER